MATAKEISKLLANRAEEVARYLLPAGKRVGSEWRVGSIDGDSGQSLGVHLTGEKAGVFCDFAAEDSGDLLNLWAATRRITLAEAIKEASQYLGLACTTFTPQRTRDFLKPNSVSLQIDNSSEVMSYLTQERKLSAETLRAFQIGENKKKIIFNYFRDDALVLIKFQSLNRIGNKKEITVAPNCEPCLFGWHTIPPNTRSIVICEGEIDAMTLYQYGLAALSVPFGGGKGNKHKWLEYEFDRMQMFDEIFLCFDNDQEGKIAVAELTERLGRYRCRVVELPLKDANACLQANITNEEMQKYFNDAKTIDPLELKSATFFVEHVIETFYPSENAFIGYNPPWQKAQGKIHFRNEELSIWTGINGHGKSQFLGNIILSLMKDNARVCIASLELKPNRLLNRLTRQAAGLADPSEAYIRAIHEWYSERLWLFDLVGTAKAARLLEVFLYARQRYGIDVFVIDSFMKLDIAEDDYRAQKMLIEQLCDFKNQHSCQIHVVVHPRKAIDETQAPGKLDSKGTGAISDLADNCFCIWRNKNKENLKALQLQGISLTPKQLEELRLFDTLWICDKQRNGDWEGKLGFGFDPKSLQYLASEAHKPTQFVEFSQAIKV